VPISDTQNWIQATRDRAGNILAQREVPLSPNVSSVRQEAAKFLQYVIDNHGDLKSSVESELESVRSSLSDLLKRMDSSRNQDEIRRLREPMSVNVALVSYLEQALERARPMTVGQFVAEALEEEAAKMPDSLKEQAESLRRAAQIEREHGGNRTIRVWDMPAEDSNRI
jgi:hypothetical protein